ncbi:PREDICTED: uncharacterized protein LOC106320894 [Brassica oleracea var. oleracea]|uniref:uncharacterized protein LOC106320894 n=1 Tax=Brassica oleracea var. oleracea TaxID=109376 RepID=UPI0006A6B038|nr:PREDICTED: uncharacterized protein LOC106320894 [Brassica oleracea var. oleracea]
MEEMRARDTHTLQLAEKVDYLAGMSDYRTELNKIKDLQYETEQKMVPMELLKEVGIIGASHGWVATLKNGIVCQDDLDLHAPDNNPKRIPLPPLETLPHNQTQIVTNIAMSSSSPEDEDCIVAVKFLGPQLSLCRPAQRDCTWSNIRISDPSFFSSHVMYSKRDEMFSMPSSRGHYTRSWDLVRHMKEPKLQMLMQPPEDQIPRMTKRAWQRLESCCTKQHYLVESSHTDETFMLKWYTQSRPTLNVWDHFLLLKIDKEGNALYTKDIGDLCILLSRSEPICIPAKLNRRAKNCIYMLTEHEFAIVGIGSNQKFCRTPFTCSLPYYISKN